MDKKREKQLKDEYWKQINEDFERLAENERYMQQKLKYEKELEKIDALIEEKDTQLKQLDVLIEEKDNTISKLQQTQQNAYQELLKKGLTLEEISKIFSVDVDTIQNVIKKIAGHSAIL